MTAVLLLTRAVGFLALVAAIAGAVWLVARLASKALRKVSIKSVSCSWVR